MRAVVVNGPGSIAKLRIEEVDRPVVPKEGVLVRVHGSSVNPVDLYTLTPVAHLQRWLKPAVIGTHTSCPRGAARPARSPVQPCTRGLSRSPRSPAPPAGRGWPYLPPPPSRGTI